MRQLNDFTSLSDGRKYPTDIDGFIEWKDKIRIFIEIKRIGVQVPLGQKIALERLCNDMTRLKKESIVIVAEHNVEPTSDRIDVGSCLIREYFYKFKWNTPKVNIVVKDAITQFLNKFNL
jgi:hypothetical protein